MDQTRQNADPVAIVEQMKTLTDIEGDLAETAIAVQATDPSLVSETAAENGTDDLAAAPTAADASDAAVQQGTVQTAEAMETVLESAIPPGPEDSAAAAVPEATSSTSGQTQVATIPQINPSTADADAPFIQPDSTDQAPSTTQSTQQPNASASQVQEVVQAVAADVNNPILPSNDSAIPTDIPRGETKEAAPPVKVNVAASSIPPSAQFDVSAPFSSDPQFLEDAKELPSQTPYQSLQAPTHDVDLPAGLTPTSASVSENAQLINLWKRDPKDPRTILELFEFSVQRTEAADARAWYHTLSEIEPAAVKPLLALINLELSLSNFSEVESLFARALKGTGGDITAAADVSIWKAYLHYIRRQNPIAEGATNVEQVRSTITKAYEFALQQCGTDRESGDVWQEYIGFLSEANPKNTWETQQQMDSLRKVYQRAVCIPLNNVEALWKAYDAFESGLNKLTAKKFLAERSPAYMTARTALRELRALTEGLPHPSLPPQPDYSDHDRSIVNLWKSYLRWEESNPLVIEDQSVLNTRVKYALRQCLGDMRHFPELWHNAANWHIQAGRKDDAAEVLQAGVEACPQSFLLTFALADLEEDRGKFSTCHEIYEALLNRLNPEIDELKIAVAAEVDRARGPEITRPTGDDAMNGDDGLAEVTRMIDEREARGRHVAERRGKDVEELSTAASVVWIMYMRFARRAEGIKAARGIFGKARKSPHITWHIFEASAMMEYHSNKDSAVAIRIFELGFKLFSEVVDYVVRYLQFLLSVNDDSNARALFERSAPKIPAEKARPLWDTWARYEYMYGDLSGVHKLEGRFSEVFPHDSPLKRFAQRFIYNGVDQVALRDLGFGQRQAAPALVPVTVEPTLPPPPASLPPIPAMPAHSPPQKRSYPDRSPRAHGRLRGSADRSQSPSAKRYRPASPPRRYPLPERERVPSAGRYDERSSLPPPPGGRGSIPPHGPPPMGNMGPPRGSVPPPGDFDRSGLTRPLAWFVDSLPSARSFNGPVFRADDIMHLFSNIGRDGRGIPTGPPPPARAAYPPPENRYGGPPPRGRY